MVPEFHRLLKAPDNTSFFLFGMRGTGKSTWARSALGDSFFIDLLDETAFQSYLVDSGRLARELATIAPERWVVIDEIQRLPSLLNEVHRAIHSRSLRFALLGSSARKLRSAGVNLLGGRALSRQLHPLLPAELGQEFDLDRVLQFGSLPLIWRSPLPKEQLQAYVQLYLKVEIQSEALVRNLPGFARFLNLASLFHGQVLNVESLARDAKIARSTALGYLEILEDTLLAFRLPAYDAKARVKERKHPKFFWADNGVARAAGLTLHEPTSQERGPLFEAFIIQTLNAYKELQRLDCDRLSYWSTHEASTEVDVLIHRGPEVVALEVKYGQDVRNDWFRGLRALGDSVPLQRRIVVYRGSNRQTTDDGIEIWPLEYFLSALQEKTLIR